MINLTAMKTYPQKLFLLTVNLKKSFVKITQKNICAFTLGSYQGVLSYTFLYPKCVYLGNLNGVFYSFDTLEVAPSMSSRGISNHHNGYSQKNTRGRYE